MINDYEATQPITTDATIPHTTWSNDEVISTLNGLIQTAKDGEDGYRQAAEAVESPDLKTFFNEGSLERARFAGELQQLVASLGGEPETNGSIAGAAFQGWMDLKAAIASNESKAILNECERGEDWAKKAYLNALDGALPDNIRSVVEQQSFAVRERHDQVKAKRDAANNQGTRTAGGGF